MSNIVQYADAVLRGEGQRSIGAPRTTWVSLVLVVTLSGSIYGAVMGAYNLRALQMLYAALKVPLLLAVATLVCLPSFYAINSALGLRGHLRASLHGILAAQATLGLTILALTPVTAFFYVSTFNYNLAILFNGVIFAVGTAAAQIVLARHYRPLVAVNPRHRIAKRAWITTYVFVAIQTAWVLRPFVGTPERPTEFFRERAWSNAYLEVWRILLEAF